MAKTPKIKYNINKKTSLKKRNTKRNTKKRKKKKKKEKNHRRYYVNTKHN